MPTIAVRIPQMGEGLQEARLVATLKNPGDKVRRDEPIYQMETDKAVMDVESPYEGTLVEWLAAVDSILPIGSPVASMDVAEGAREMEIHGAPAAATAPAQITAPAAAVGLAGARNAAIPPRTRAYARDKGISDSDLAAIPSASGKLMPADIDAHLAGAAAPGAAVVGTAASPGGPFSEMPLSGKQRLLSSRLARSSQVVVPGTITVVADWEPIERVRAAQKARGGDFQPSTFTMYSYAVVQAMEGHPGFRSAMRGDDTLRTYEHVSLGIAVALPGDELVTAVVDRADTMDWPSFAAAARERIELARGGKDQAHEAVTVSLTNMQHAKLRDAVPVLVAPSVGVIFLGEVYNGLDNDVVGEVRLKRLVNLVLTFDHRLINGVGAAEFMNAIKANVETIGSLATVV